MIKEEIKRKKRYNIFLIRSTCCQKGRSQHFTTLRRLLVVFAYKSEKDLFSAVFCHHRIFSQSGVDKKAFRRVLTLVSAEVSSYQGRAP